MRLNRSTKTGGGKRGPGKGGSLESGRRAPASPGEAGEAPDSMRDRRGAWRLSLLDLDAAGLEAFLAGIGEQAFRARQIREWVYRRNIIDYAAMTNIPAMLREKLSSDLPADPFASCEPVRTASDGTEKLELATRDGERIQTVIIPQDQRVTLCISTQAGCALACAFCATGAAGYRRNLTRAEILGQVVHSTARSGRRISNVVFMGMGEPLLNYRNVMSAVRELADENGLAVGTRKITVSTVGVVQGIIRMCSEELHPNLAISLHSADQRQREKLAPSARKWKLDEILEAAELYAAACGRPVTFEYTLIDGVNSSQADADRLGKLLKKRSAKVNLIPVNPVPGMKFKPPDGDSIRRFKLKIEAYGIIATLRTGRGSEIQAACGQLKPQV